MRGYSLRLRKRALVTGEPGFLGSHLCERVRKTIDYFRGAIPA
jgi:hypothetical protein